MIGSIPDLSAAIISIRNRRGVRLCPKLGKKDIFNSIEMVYNRPRWVEVPGSAGLSVYEEMYEMNRTEWHNWPIKSLPSVHPFTMEAR